MIDPKLIEQWTIESGFLLRGTVTEALIKVCERAAAHGAEQREKELLATGMEPVPFVVTRMYGNCSTDRTYFTSEQVSAARLQGASVNQQLLESLTELVPILKSWQEDFPDDVGDKEKPALRKAVAAIAAASQEAQASKRVPLTGEQIDEIYARVSDEYDKTAEGYESHNFSRAIEAAHGITGEQT